MYVNAPMTKVLFLVIACVGKHRECTLVLSDVLVPIITIEGRMLCYTEFD
jgi:hypothetical protein